MLKESDEYAYRQFDEHSVQKNSKRTYAFSVLLFIIGLVFLIISVKTFDVATKGALLKTIGSVILLSTSLFLFFCYKTELGLYKPDISRLRILFYIFWNLSTIGGFCISVAYFQSEKATYIYLLFVLPVLAIPVFSFFENLVATAVYLIPCVYFGIADKTGIGYYMIIIGAALVFMWINALKTDYIFRNWINSRKIKEVSDRCSSLSQVDNLTGMLNRAGLAARFKERYKNKNDGGKIAVIMADIDNFRFYNHKNGYDQSDRCLYNICNCIRIISKPVTNMVSRFGGDDFILVLENMDEVEVVTFAEQLRDSVERMAIPFGDKGVITISVGISGISEFENDDTYSKLLNEADIQLMIAKSSGKNCIGYRNRAFIQQNGRNKE